jgi:predicted ArsR family transcriptional regulator
MSSRERFGREYIEAELQTIADHLQTEVEAYLIGGGAMSLHEPSLKDTTKDIDLVVKDEAALSRLMGVLDGLGYEEATNLGDEYDELGARHCVRNDAGCQFDIFYRQIAEKLFFSDGMQARSEPFLSDEYFSVDLVAFEDIFLFKAVAERPDDIGDMATLVQTDLDFEIIEEEIERQISLLGGELFVTVISESLERLDQNEGIQTPLDDVVPEYHQRYMQGFELRMQLDEDTPKSVSELAAELSVSEDEIERRFEYLEQYDFANRTSEGIRDTGEHDKFTQS